MAQAKRKTEWDASPKAAVTAEVAFPAGASPARALQQLLQERAGIVGDEVRWSRRRSVAFVVSVSAALWMALLAISHAAMTALA